MKKVFPLLLCFLLVFGVILLLQEQGTSAESNLTPIESLGKRLFFDTNLSTPAGQSCAACHGSETGFTGPDEAINAHGAVYEGAVAGRFGNRKPPTIAYGGKNPMLYKFVIGLWVGGMFDDGRASGWTLEDPLAEQAQGPFLNPLEQNNSNSSEVVQKVKISDYADLFEEVWGAGSLNDVNGAYEKIVRSIAAYERSYEVSAFTSKYDAYLAGQVKLTELEAQGLDLFQGKAKCANCHTSTPGPLGPPLFTNFTFYNLGIPKNPENPFYSMSSQYNPDGATYIDYGLGNFLRNAGYSQEIYEFELGKFRVPTLRNVDLRPSPDFVKAYGHNGYFKSLEQIVNFYNTRDVGDWPDPEVSANLDTMLTGNLGLTLDEEKAIVAFMGTLNDGYTPPQPITIGPEILLVISALVLAVIAAVFLLRRQKSRANSAGGTGLVN